MGLLTKLFCDASGTEFKLSQDLLAIAIVDGEISETERKTICEICYKEAISDDTVNDCLMGFDKYVKALIPAKRRERADYLTKLIRVMGVDVESSHMEIYLLEIIASKMGISHMVLVSLMLMTATRTYFSGDTGSRILSSFLHNVIDPKGKNLRANCDIIKKIFDLMAENVPQHQNEEEDKAALAKAMNDATYLLMENSLYYAMSSAQ